MEVKKKSIVIPILSGLVIVGALLAVDRAAHRVAAAQRTDATDSNVAVGLAPNFDLKTLDGKDLTLASLRCRGVLVNFWATYCAPCNTEMPWLEALQKKYADQGFTIVGVAMDDASPEDITKFAKNKGITYPLVQGTDRVGESYGAQFLPTSVYIDRNGRIVNRVYGIVSQKEIEKNIQETLRSAPAGGHK